MTCPPYSTTPGPDGQCPSSHGTTNQTDQTDKTDKTHWLLSAAPSIPQAHTEWQTAGAAWLLPGQWFTALVIPAPTIHQALLRRTPEECAAPLAEALEDGPVFYTPTGFGRHGSYTALVPATTTLNLTGAVVHPRRALLLVPAPNRTTPVEDGTWWAVPPATDPGRLCPPDHLDTLIRLGHPRATGR